MLVPPPERIRCRRCGATLTRSTLNDRSAFCCRGCYRIFYSKRCLVCEEPKEGNRILCGRRECRLQFNGFKRHQVLGRYYTPQGGGYASANPIKQGVCVVGPKDVPINLVGGYRFPGAKVDQLPVGLLKGSCSSMMISASSMS
jgi:hypothetical protein